MTNLTITELAAKTEHGYSFERYGQKGWESAITALRAHGLTDTQVINWMLSKHTRWAADIGNGENYGNLHGETLIKNYIARYPKFITEKELAELAE